MGQFVVVMSLIMFLNRHAIVFRIHSPIEGYRGCFQFSIVMNKPAVNICAQVSYGHNFSNNLAEYLKDDFWVLW